MYGSARGAARKGGPYRDILGVGYCTGGKLNVGLWRILICGVAFLGGGCDRPVFPSVPEMMMRRPIAERSARGCASGGVDPRESEYQERRAGRRWSRVAPDLDTVPPAWDID